MTQLLALALILLAFTALDLLYRRIPLPLIFSGLGIAVILGSPESPNFWAGLALGVGLTALAGFPGGDWKAAGVLGALAGPAEIAMVLTLAFVLTLLRWRLKKRVAPEPWMPYILVSFLFVLGIKAIPLVVF